MENSLKNLPEWNDPEIDGYLLSFPMEEDVIIISSGESISSREEDVLIISSGETTSGYYTSGRDDDDVIVVSSGDSIINNGSPYWDPYNNSSFIV